MNDEHSSVQFKETIPTHVGMVSLVYHRDFPLVYHPDL